MRLERLLPRGKRRFIAKEDASLTKLSRGDRIRMALTELGPTFVKLGQFMSNRPDVLPPEIITALRDLQDAVAPFDPEESIRILEQEFHKPVAELFARFDRAPIASASISQVHRAKLPDGTNVAVKIQRPRLDQIIETDIDILHQITSLMEKHVQEVKYFNPIRMCDEFDRNLRKEIDFRNEASHIERFAENFRGDPDIHVPALYRQFSTKRVITMEYIDGIKASDVEKLRSAGLDARIIAQRGTTLVLKQIFEYGFFHADPHPGNLFILPGNVICFLDFGIMGVLSPTLKEYLLSILLGVVNKDPQKIVRTLAMASQQSITDMHGLEYDVTELIEEFAMLSLRDVNVGELLKRLTRLIVTHRIRILPGFYLLLKSMITIEGVGYGLDPDFRLLSYVEPFAKKMLSEGLNPLAYLRGLYCSGMDIGHMLRDIPYDVKDILGLLKAGKVRIEFQHRGLEPMLRMHARLVNRIVFAVILASLVMGSSLVVLSGIPPKIYDIPLIGIIGFIAAGVIAFWLLASMLVGKKI